MKFSRYIPEGSQEVKRLGFDCVVYVYGLSAIGYQGKQSKKAFHYRFKTEDQLTNHINKFFDNVKARQDMMEKRRQNRLNSPNELKLGDLLHYSWGYDQTNCDFFQVIGKTKKTVTIREIASKSVGPDGFMSTYCVPVRDKFLEDSKPQQKKVIQKTAIPMPHGWCDKVEEGQSHYSSWYA